MMRAIVVWCVCSSAVADLNLDAVAVPPPSWDNEDAMYFFKGRQYWTYLNYQQAVASGPHEIGGGWPGVPDDVDAIVVPPSTWDNKDAMYFFKGRQYWKYLNYQQAVASGPYEISGGWSGVPDVANDLDAILSPPSRLPFAMAGCFALSIALAITMLVVRNPFRQKTVALAESALG